MRYFVIPPELSRYMGWWMPEIRINQGKLEAENSQLRARYEDLSLQNDRMRDVIGNKLENNNLIFSLALTPWWWNQSGQDIAWNKNFDYMPLLIREEDELISPEWIQVPCAPKWKLCRGEPRVHLGHHPQAPWSRFSLVLIFLLYLVWMLS